MQFSLPAAGADGAGLLLVEGPNEDCEGNSAGASRDDLDVVRASGGELNLPPDSFPLADGLC